MFNWIKRLLLGDKSKQAYDEACEPLNPPVQPKPESPHSGDNSDLYRRYIVAMAFETGGMLIGGVDGVGNLVVNGRVVTPDEARVFLAGKGR